MLVALLHSAGSFRKRLTNVCPFSTHFEEERNSSRMRNASSFRQLKKYIGKAPLLSKMVQGKKLYLYLAISEHAITVALIREEGNIQWLVYYISKRLLDTKTRYLEMEKLALALVT